MIKGANRGDPIPLPPALDEQLQRFLTAYKRRQAPATTISDYRHPLTGLCRFLANVGVSRAQDVKLSHLREYLDSLIEQGLSIKTQRYYSRLAAQWLRWLIIDDAQEDDADLTIWKLTTDKILHFTERDLPSPPPHHYPVVVWEELRRFITRISAEREPPDTLINPMDRLTWLRRRALYLVYWSTACRRAEILTLNKSDVSAEVVIKGKGGDERVIYLSEDAIDACKKYIKARKDINPALFVSHTPRHYPKHTKRLGYQAVSQMIQQDRAVSGIANMTTHKFRHLVALTVLNLSGGNMALVQKLLGHKSMLTTQLHYARYDNEAIQAALSDVHPAHRKHKPGPKKKGEQS